MLNSALTAISFIFFILLFTVVGIFSTIKKRNTTEDYLLASRNVNPWLISQSAFATSHSGYMFIGLIGWTYQVGILSIWVTSAWMIGDFIGWLLVYRRLRQVSEETASNTIGSFLGQNEPGSRKIAIASALITIILLGTYASAQLVAGSKALNVIFGWNYASGIILGAIIVLVYCFSGGIRASIWTDTIQSVLMVIAMSILVALAISSCGGVDNLWIELGNIDANLTQIIPQDLKFGFATFFVSWLAMGFGVVGQPHIMVRAMAIDSVKSINLAFSVYAITAVIFNVMAVMMGLAARVLLPNLLTGGDPELAMPILATQLLPEPLVGLVLAGVFASVVSTADSQILSCSAALSQDLLPKAKQSYRLVKIGTLLVTLLTMIIALTGNQNVFSLTIFSWSTLAAGLAPLLILRVFRVSLNSSVALGMMGIGIFVTLLWKLGLQFSDTINEVLPGMAAGVLVYLIAQQFQNSLTKKE